VRTRRATIAIGAHVTLALVSTWPLVLDWRTRLPLGAEGVGTVPYFNLWTLRWNAERIAAGFRGYWDAPIFWPLRGTFARSEAQPLTGLVYALWHPIGGDVGAYNLTLWTLLTLNGLALTLLARRLGAGFGAAVLAGALGQTVAFVGNELGVIQLVPLFPVWLVLERLVAYRDRPGWRRLAGAGAWCAVLALTSGYYALFLGTALLVVGPILVGRSRPLWLLARDVAIAGLVALAIAGPFLLAQQHQTTAEGWSTETVTALSARPGDFVRHDPATVDVPWAFTRDGGQALFAGGVVALLAAIGVGAGVTHRPRVVATLLAGAIVMFVVAVGLRLRWGDLAPYALLRDHVPGFDRLRSPFRAGALVQAFVVVLAACGLAWLWRWRRPAGRILAVALTCASVVETVHWGQPTIIVPSVARFDWVQHLAVAPDGPVVMIPFPEDGGVEAYEDTTIAMLAGLEHGHPLLNGYTGLFPQAYRDLRADMSYFPDDYDLRVLRDIGASYVVLRHDFARYSESNDWLERYGWTRTLRGTARDVWRAPATTSAPSSPPTSP
jgi:hypothetical protein